MSGHSKWANIKGRKGVEDKKRGQIFSKLARAIVVAVKEVGSGDPDNNPKLRLILERGRAANMPKDNIERAIDAALNSKESLEEMLLEGYGPGGVGILIEAMTNNRQRTIQEIKSIFQRVGGALAEPGAVSFQFKKRGVVEVEKPESEEKLLSLIDLGAEDFEENGNRVLIYLSPDKLVDFKKGVEELGYKTVSLDLIMQPTVTIPISDASTAKVVINLMESLEEHDDVQRVFSNFDIPNEFLEKGTSN